MGRKWQRVPEILGAHGCAGERSFHQPRPPGRTDPTSSWVQVLGGNVLQPFFANIPGIKAETPEPTAGTAAA